MYSNTYHTFWLARSLTCPRRFDCVVCYGPDCRFVGDGCGSVNRRDALSPTYRRRCFFAVWSGFCCASYFGSWISVHFGSGFSCDFGSDGCCRAGATPPFYNIIVFRKKDFEIEKNKL